MKVKIIIPSWCKYPEPTNGLLGCFSLLSGIVQSAQHCNKCDFFESSIINEIEVVDNQRILKNLIEGKVKK